MVHEGVMRRSEDAEADFIRSGISRLVMMKSSGGAEERIGCLGGGLRKSVDRMDNEL
jgi:hypothetical protein